MVSMTITFDLETDRGAIAEAARVYRYRWRGGGMAARRGRTAGRADCACRRVDTLARDRRGRSGKCDRLCTGAKAFRVGRGQEYPNRLPLCREQSNSVQDLCGRTGRPVAGRNSGKLHSGGRGVAGADAHDANRFRACGRSRRAGALFKASRGPAATSPGSAASTRR